MTNENVWCILTPIQIKEGEDIKMKKMAKTAVVALALALSLSFAVSTTADAKVKVSKVTSVNKLTGSKSITLTKGKKATLKTTVTVKPNKAANKKVTYKSSKKSVATVTKKGVITAKKVGSAKITVTSKKNSKKKATVKVKVVAGKVTKVALTAAATEIKIGESTTVSAKVSTKGKKPNKKLVWKTSDSKIATVDEKGNVSGVAEGKVTITATSTDGTKKSAKVEISVVKKTTTLALKDKTPVKATVKFVAGTKNDKIAEDVEKAVAMLGAKDKEVTLKIDGKEYKVKGSDAKAKIAAKANAKSSVVVEATTDATYSLASAVFTPATVESITLNDVTFSKITATSFNIGNTTYTYTASGKNVVVDGHVAADFAKVTAITATQN